MRATGRAARKPQTDPVNNVQSGRERLSASLHNIP